MKNEIKYNEFIDMAEKDIEKANKHLLVSDNSILAKAIYQDIFDFYIPKQFSGDLIFTWKSASMVKNGDYVGKRNTPVDNWRVIGNIIPSYCSNRKYSLNMNRNGILGDFPHDYFDIYLDHVAKYAYHLERPQIKEYYPLKRAILYKDNVKFFMKFKNFNDFLKRNYLTEIWEQVNTKPFSDMEFTEFEKISKDIILKRGEIMINKIIEAHNT